MSFESDHDFSCQFCDERISTSDDMRTHLWLCASKTDVCPLCNKNIQRSIFAYHMDNNCIDPDIFEVMLITKKVY